MRSFNFYLFCLLLCLPWSSYAQYNLPQNNVWIYSAGYGLDFSSGTPVPFSTPLRSLGGSASVADASGNLLFYTQGDTIWNKNHQVMPNGAGLIAPYTSNTGGTQSEQGQLIIPVIGTPGQYYVFSMQNSGDFMFGVDAFASKLFYSVVNMSLNNGLGDVVAGQKGIMIDSMLSANKLIAVPGDSCNIWVITHNVFDNGFKCFNVKSTGIDMTPVESVTGNLSGGIAYVEGMLRISTDRTRLAASSAFGLSLQEVGLDLFDFDPATGIISNPVLIDSNTINHAACFSPDNSKLYSLSSDTDFNYFILYQYDLSQPTVADIIASKTPLDTSNTFNYVKDLRLAPDGKIYIAMHEPATYLSVINNPNLPAAQCGYVDSAINMNMPNAIIGNTCFPNEFVTWIVDTPASVASDSVLTTSGTIVLNAPAGYTDYVWNTGATTSSLTANDTGTYWVEYSDICTWGVDSFHVDPAPVSVAGLQNNNNVLVFPNPASGLVKVEMQGTTGNLELSVTDMTGKIVMSKDQKNGDMLNVQNLSNGIYLLSITDKNRKQSTSQVRIVIIH